MGSIEAPPSQLFYDRYNDQLAELFERVGLPDQAIASLDSAVYHTQPWVKGDHSRPQHMFAIHPDQHDALHGLYADLQLKQEVPLPPGHYNEIIVLGGLQAGNRRRMDFLTRMLTEGSVTTDHISLLGGQRYLYPEKEKDDLEASFAAAAAQGLEDDWTRRLQTADTGKIWETDALRLAAVERLGKLTLERINLRANEAATRDVPDPLAGYEFQWGDTPVSLIHTWAVARAIGESRHTTKASLQDWLQRTQPNSDSRNGFVSANPHINRTVRAASATLLSMYRGDVQLIGGGSAAADGLGHGFYLGEVARNLYEDQESLTTYV